MDRNLYQCLPTLCRVCLKQINYNAELNQLNCTTTKNGLTTIPQKSAIILQEDSMCHDCYSAVDSTRRYSQLNNIHTRSIFNEIMEENRSDLLTYKIVSDILKADDTHSNGQVVDNTARDIEQIESNQEQYLYSKSVVLFHTNFNSCVGNKDHSIDYLTSDIKRNRFVGLDDKQNVDSLCCTLSRGNILSNGHIAQEIRSGNNVYSESTNKCSTCGFTAANKSKLTTHMITRTKQEPHSSFHQFTDFHNGKFLKCDVCSYETLFNSELAGHTKTHKKSKPYKCTECEFRCSSRSYLNVHMRIHTGENPYKCDICSYSTPFKYTLSVYMRSHVGPKPYRCTQCDFRCSTRGYLETHMRIHTGETPYKCNICGYSTTFKYTLSVHMRTHLGSKPYQCTECNFKCSSESYLKKHVKGHSGEVYTCSICTYSATCRSMVTHHMKTHTGEKLYKCTKCDYQAYKNYDVRKHMKIHVEKPV